MARVKAEYILETDQAKKSLDQLGKEFDELTQSQKENTKALKEINKEFNKLSKTEQETSVRGKELTKQRRELTLAILKQRQESNKLKKTIIDEIKNSKTQVGSIRALREANNKLVAERERLNTQSVTSRKRFKDLTKQISKNEVAIKEYDKAIGRSQRNVGNYGTAVGKLTSLLGIAGLAGATLLVQRALSATLSILSETSDKLADVQKTTGLAKEEIAWLVDELKKIDTRTPLNSLLEIATAAGRLNVPKDQILDFTKTVDKVFVAIKKQKTDQIVKKMKNKELEKRVKKLDDEFRDLIDYLKNKREEEK